jgi:phosphoribosyl 1,2-cyclic phosphodiesterase
VLRLAEEANVKRAGLFHLNQERYDDDMDKIVNACQKHISDKGLGFDCFAVASDMTFSI